jgi:hypothetical protein
MRKNIFLLFLLPVLHFSCTKTDQLKPADQPLETTAAGRTATTETNNPAMYLDIDYGYGSSTIGMHAFVDWPVGTPQSYYTMRFTISGTYYGGGSGEVELGMSSTQSSVSYADNVIYSDPYSSITLSVKAELLKGSTVIASASQSITTVPAVSAASAPANPMATITLKPVGDRYYDIKASGLNYLNGHPERKFYFYAFYFPSDYQRYNLLMKPFRLGSTTIYGDPMFSTEGGFRFHLPDEYDISNIRVLLTKTEYPDSYFSDRLLIPNVEDYLIDWCLNDITMYGIPLSGFNSTNIGQFSSWMNATSSIGYYVGSLDPMLNMQIDYLKNRGFLW